MTYSNYYCSIDFGLICLTPFSNLIDHIYYPLCLRLKHPLTPFIMNLVFENTKLRIQQKIVHNLDF